MKRTRHGLFLVESFDDSITRLIESFVGLYGRNDHSSGKMFYNGIKARLIRHTLN